VLRIDVITIFPDLLGPFLRESIVGKAIQSGLLAVEIHDLRRWTTDPHRTVDDSPYGGGPGMVMKPEPLVTAIESVAGPKGVERSARVVMLSPQGERLNQARLAGLLEEPRLVLVCGRYEGVDQRAIDLAVDEELSIGDYVLSGGEVPAMVVIEGMSRLVPGVLGNPESNSTESFQGPTLEGPQYTRPAEFRGQSVPEVLLSGDHGAVARWRAERSNEVTRRRRPDLLCAREGEKQS
jgi:tRNA (guanine37-N1)-methyltransferase